MCAGKTRQSADNTFILTVDGDTDFEPHSIQKMLNQLRGNKEVGVVCGRIHPIGDGKLIEQCTCILYPSTNQAVLTVYYNVCCSLRALENVNGHLC